MSLRIAVGILRREDESDWQVEFDRVRTRRHVVKDVESPLSSVVVVSTVLPSSSSRLTITLDTPGSINGRTLQAIAVGIDPNVVADTGRFVDAHVDGWIVLRPDPGW